jgi:hypothetical protein
MKKFCYQKRKAASLDKSKKFTILEILLIILHDFQDRYFACFAIKKSIASHLLQLSDRLN